MIEGFALHFVSRSSGAFDRGVERRKSGLELFKAAAGSEEVVSVGLG